MSKPRIILLYCSDKFDSYSIDWLDAFLEADYLSCTPIDLYDLKNGITKLKKAITDSDFIVALHSVNTNSSNIRAFMPYVPILKKRKIPYITFIGNEYNIPFRGCRLSEKINLFKLLKPEFICTQLKLESAKILYKELTESTIVEYPHALNEKIFISSRSSNERRIDIGIKTGRYGNYLGDKERNAILDFFKDNSYRLGLNSSIENTQDSKVGRQGWVDYLNNCKGTIGNESGTSFTEADDHTVINIMHYAANKLKLKKQPKWFDKFEELLYDYKPYVHYPTLLKIYELFNTKLFLIRLSEFSLYSSISNYDFDDIYDKFFKNYQTPISTRCISSRHFDAIGTKTCQILFEGDYNYLLKPDVHYLKLNKDYSNIDEVIRKFKDQSYRESITNEAYKHMLEGHTYKHRIKNFYTQVLLTANKPA